MIFIIDLPNGKPENVVVFLKKLPGVKLML